MPRPPQVLAAAPLTVSAHLGDHRFPSCTAESTPRPSEDAALFQLLLRSLSAVTAPPKYTNSFVCLYTWPAALIVNDTFPPPLVCRHMISVSASETAYPNDEHAVTITAIILSSLFEYPDTMPASSAYSIPHNICTSSSFPLRPSTLPVREVPSFSPFSFR